MDEAVKYLEELEWYEQGRTESELTEAFGVSRGTMQCRLHTFRKQGILTGSHKTGDVSINWETVQK